MIVAKSLMDNVLEALETAVFHAEAKRIPKGETLEEMKKVLRVAKLKTGGKA